MVACEIAPAPTRFEGRRQKTLVLRKPPPQDESGEAPMADDLPDVDAQTFQRALALHRDGRLEEAGRLYLSLLQKEGDDFNVLHLLGLVRFQSGAADEAADLIGRAVARNPSDPSALSNLGLALARLGRHEEAILRFSRALALAPTDAEIRFNRAVSAQSLGRFEAALADYGEAVALRPDYVDALLNQGVVLHRLERFEDACIAFERAIRLNPRAVDAYVNCAASLEKLGRRTDALAACDLALLLAPDHAGAHLNKSGALQALGRFDEMLASCERALAARPDLADAHLSRGMALKALGRFEDALAALDQALARGGESARARTERGVVLEGLGDLSGAAENHLMALALDGGLAQAHVNLGVAFVQQGRCEEALACYERAIGLSGPEADLLTHQAVALEKLHRTEEALTSYAKALALDPDYVRARVNRSHLLLSLGRYAEGFADYEWRKRGERPVGDRRFAEPALQPGQDVAGRTVLVHWEQGFGDTIQFSRFLQPLHARGARVLFAPQDELRGLMAGLGPHVELVTLGDAGLRFDLHCPLLSLPWALGIGAQDLGAATPYLRADEGGVGAGRVRAHLGAGPKIGLAWSGSPGHRNDAARSMPLETLIPLLERPERFFSLQKTYRAGEAALARRLLVDLSDDLHDFSETAAVIDALDLVVCVDTAVAHLAGALGKPVWIMLPQASDWRWLRGRDDSPWHPTARLFRQAPQEDWSAVVQRVSHALGAFRP
jgi:tetratricopeptide (TPR) repeat protein